MASSQVPSAASLSLLQPSQLLLHRQIEKLLHCRQLLHYQKLFHCHQLLHFQKLFHSRELLYYHQWLQVFSEVWLCELSTCCIFETTFVWGSKVMRMLLALSSVSVTSSVLFCKVTDDTCWRRFSKVLVKIVNQRSAPLLVTHSIPDASLLQSTAFWWVEQFWHLTEVPETSVMCFLQTKQDRSTDNLRTNLKLFTKICSSGVSRIAGPFKEDRVFYSWV